MKFVEKPININIIQVYAPTSDQPDDELDEFYETVEHAMRQCKTHEITAVMDNLNAKEGEGRNGALIGSFSLGERNERGGRWCEGNFASLQCSGTCFGDSLTQS